VRLANPGAEARLVGRVDNYRPFDATWLVYLSAALPLPARLAGWTWPGEPTLSVEHFDPRNDRARLRESLERDRFVDAGDILAGPWVTRLEIRVNDRGESSVFRVNLGARPDRAWARAAVDEPRPDRAGVCAAAVASLIPDPVTLEAGVYLGSGGDWHFGSGWRSPEPSPAGYHRRTAGPEATLLLPIEQRAAITLRFSVAGLNGASEVALKLNGRELPARPLSAGWNELEWLVEADAWRPGVNEVSIRAIAQPGSPAAEGSAPLLRFRRVVLDWGG
jgi:hypothetical protein